MASERNVPAQHNPTGQELDQQYDELHESTGQKGPNPSGERKAIPGRKPTGQELDEQYDLLHQDANADAPPG